ncbi:hypothetical protein BC938DRAFT_480020 [Jimgerdemannia flammicorona]|uniref:Uncharacterized protein n=1 Tax=Jimgerdemannia flammicorona TaxID=994334 RepID=A0A433QJJ3_9FUNG|nr:hypothetical protein BC938DRAFT_480020 [Jimgerdemannia flammicorona]
MNYSKLLIMDITKLQIMLSTSFSQVHTFKIVWNISLELHWSEHWWHMQDSLNIKSTTIILILLSVDETHLNILGQQKAYSVYLMIGNIPKKYCSPECSKPTFRDAKCHIWHTLNSSSVLTASVDIAFLSFIHLLLTILKHTRYALFAKVKHVQDA